MPDKMLLHVNSKDLHVEDELITVDVAFELLDSQSNSVVMEDNFIGFTHPHNPQAIIQFVRKTNKEWVIDIPAYQDKKYFGSLSAEIPHDIVFRITMDFFDANSKIQFHLANEEYSKIKQIFLGAYKVPLLLL